MKIWLKYIIGCLIGIAAAIIIPAGSASFEAAIKYINELTIHIGRYTLVPLLFFTMTVAVFELYDSRLLFKVAIRTVLITVVASFALTFLGIIIVLIANPPRIPISVEGVSQRVTLDIAANFMRLFPFSSFHSLLEGSFLVPVFILAGFAGAGCSADKTGTKQALAVFDSISRICYAVMIFFIDLLAIGMIAVSAFWMLSFRSMLTAGSFLFFALLLTGIMLFVVCGAYPLILKFVFKERKPYRILYAAIAPLVAAFFSGDANFTLAVNLRHAEGSLGVHRRINSVCMPVFSTFARGGTALVTAAAFIVVLKSYSSLGVSFEDFVWIFFISFGVSFFLGALPSGGVFFAVTILCSLYGRGFETGYLILKPAAFFMGSVAAVMDAATAFFGTYVIAARSSMVTHRDVDYFI